jgi:hypothetical protein
MSKVATIAILLLTFSAAAFAQQATPQQTEEWLKMCLAAGDKAPAGCPSTPKQTVEVTPPATSLQQIDEFNRQAQAEAEKNFVEAMKKLNTPTTYTPPPTPAPAAPIVVPKIDTPAYQAPPVYRPPVRHITTWQEENATCGPIVAPAGTTNVVAYIQNRFRCVQRLRKGN